MHTPVHAYDSMTVFLHLAAFSYEANDFLCIVWPFRGHYQLAGDTYMLHTLGVSFKV